MRVPLLIAAASLILVGDLLILAIARTIPGTIFAGKAEWSILAIALIGVGVGLALYVNLRHIA
jgi:hypothetical protein